ncbi:MAG: hypothetical protein KC621_03420 [Myxococcales bacterium]|nr:hypothetical protein [Myxococcales bacterium]
MTASLRGFPMAMGLLLWLAGCGAPPATVSHRSPDDALRIAIESAPAVAVPSCDLLVTCPQPDLAADGCVDDPELFTVTMFGDAVASVELDRTAHVPLADGNWFAPFPDPNDGCALTIFTFRVGE